MNKVRADFAVVTKDGEVVQIGRSSILQPKTCFKGGTARWYDDAQLVKKNVTESINKAENK